MLGELNAMAVVAVPVTTGSLIEARETTREYDHLFSERTAIANNTRPTSSSPMETQNCIDDDDAHISLPNAGWRTCQLCLN